MHGDGRRGALAALNLRKLPKAKGFETVPGFITIPFEKIGLYVDAHRHALPVHPSGHTESEWHCKEKPG
jgi:hypothetical protein